MAKSPDYPVPALEKGLDILEALAALNVPQSLAELAGRLDRSSSELFRMLNCLERRGYVMREAGSGKYALSLKLFTLAHAHSLTDKLLRAARRPMQNLTESLRESCHLTVLERSQLLVVAQQESPERVRVSIEVGGTFDPVTTASGRLLLAFLDERELALVLADSKNSPRSAKANDELASTLAKIRRTGVSSAESETVEGVRDLAVLVGNPAGGVEAALAVTRLMRRGERTNEAALLDALRKAAAQITSTLGIS
ncbi:MAG TPA: IclR family transcriptional regulator [Opitutaceae bacterium]|nr:IclR family transcriptional regulator [Opitutaceae bacterium]